MTPATKLYPRRLVHRVREALADTPVVFVNGPRQAGKTTLVRRLVEPDRRYLTLDDSTTLLAATHDPVGFLRGLDRVAIDEVQRAPGLMPAIKRQVDEDRRPGLFLLTGSANPLTGTRVADSLTGRMETLTLLPLAQAELAGDEGIWLDQVFQPTLATGRLLPLDPGLEARVAGGGFPAVAPSGSGSIWTPSSVETSGISPRWTKELLV